MVLMFDIEPPLVTDDPLLPIDELRLRSEKCLSSYKWKI